MHGTELSAQPVGRHGSPSDVLERAEAAAGRADGVDLADTRATAQALALDRRDAVVATDLVVGAVERQLSVRGVRVRDHDGELQRCRRDVHTVAAHGVLRPGPPPTRTPTWLPWCADRPAANP